MNFAIPFSKKFKYFNDQNIQININYKPKIKELDTFINEYRTHRINLYIEDLNYDRDFEIIQALQEKYPQTKLVLNLPSYNQELEQKLKECGLPHYYNELITSWDRFNGFLSLDITDIFIAQEFAFSAKTLSNLIKKHNKNINLRVYCNVCQSSWDNTPSIKTFFIRPEDLQLYEGIIDTFEFFADIKSPEKFNVLYEIYTKDKKWFGKLNEIIVGFKGEEDSRYFLPLFGEKRLNCKKTCVTQDFISCNLCNRIIELSHTFKDKGLIVQQIDKK